MKSHLLTLALLSCCLAATAADKPTDAKPADAKPADAKPAEAKPADHDHGSPTEQPADGKKASDGHDHGKDAKPADKDHDHGKDAKPADGKKATAPKAYPLKDCIVSDNDLDSMGEQASFVYQGQTIKVCCTSCITKFEKNPAKYLKKLEGK